MAKDYKEKVVVKVIRDNAKDIQKCYFDYLKKQPKITEAEMDVLFKVEEDGELDSVKVTKNNFEDNAFADCVSSKLKSYYFAPPPLGINRYISHTLAFKSEETAMREAKEREAAAKAPKMIPVNP